jgi:hypothetical protein
MVDPLTAKGFPGWCSRVARVWWSDFGPLAKLTAPLAIVLVIGPYLPSTVVFAVLTVLAMSLVQAAGLFTVLRRANGQAAPWGAAMRFGVRGLPRLIGWSIVCVWLAVPVVMLILLPGFASDSEPLITVGTVIATGLAMGVGGALYAALVGAVLVEGQGLSRARVLLRGRWAATSLRMLLFGVTYGAYSQLVEWLTTKAVAVVGPGLPALLVLAVAMVPVVVFQVVVVVITYAELRGRADGTGTGGLAAGLGGHPSSGTVRASSFDGASSGGPMGTVIIAGRRRRGFRWGTPVLVLAMLLGAAGPWWPGAGSSIVAVSPAAAVSPVPTNPEGGTGGDTGGSDAGSSPPAVSGSSNSGSDGESNSKGGGAPKVEPKSTPDSDVGEDKGGDSGREPAPAASAPTEPRPDSDAREGSDPGPVVAAPGPAERTQPGSAANSAAASPGTSTDQAGSAVAGSGQTRSPEPAGQIGAGPAPVPGTNPENPGVTATPRTPGTPEQPTSAATAPPARVELPPGAVVAQPGSQPAPGTQRVMFDGQPVDMPPDMLEWTNTESGTRDVWTASDRRMVVTGTCAEGTADCTAHAIDGSNRSFPFQRRTPETSVREAMNDLAKGRFAQYYLKSGVSASPTPAESDKIAADSAANQARNARNAEIVSQVISFAVPPVRALRMARLGAEMLVPSRPLLTRPDQPKNAVPAFETRGGAPGPATGAGPGRDLTRSVGTATSSGETAAGPGANTIPGPPLGAPADPKASDADTNTPPDTAGGPERPNLYQPDGTIQQWDPATRQYKTIAGPGAGAPPSAEGPSTPDLGYQPNNTTPSAQPEAGPPDNPAGSPNAVASQITPSRSPDPNAKPIGPPARPKKGDDPATVDGLAGENEAAIDLARGGYEIEQNPVVPGGKNPDYRIEGKIFDAYTPTTANPRNIWSNIQRGKIETGQTERIVLNLKNNDVDLEALRAQFRDWPMQGLKEMIVIDKQGNIQHFLP